MERIMPKLIWHLEDPRVGMCYQNYYIADLASKFVKVVLDGTGGDEIFSGYTWRYNLVKKCKTVDDCNKILFKYWQRVVKDNELDEFFSKDILKENKDYNLYEVFLNVYNNWDYQTDDYFNRVLFFDMKTFLHGLLQISDKIVWLIP